MPPIRNEYGPNYLLIEQITLGWAFITTSIGMVIYLIYNSIVEYQV